LSFYERRESSCAKIATGSNPILLEHDMRAARCSAATPEEHPMERKEVHYHNAPAGDGGSGISMMTGLIAGIVVIAVGALLWFGLAENRNVASDGSPNVTVTAPSTTGQGGGASGGGGNAGGKDGATTGGGKK
jgi:hypothetical protein